MKNIWKTFHSGRGILFMMIFLCCIIGAAVLKIASSVILPFTISALLAIVMYPIIKALDKLRFPRAISIFVIIILIVVVICLFGVVLFTSAKMIVERLPFYESRFMEIYNWAADIFDLPSDDELTFWQNLWGQQGIRTWVRDFTISFSNTFLTFLSSAVLVILFMVFILLEASHSKIKLDTAFDNRSERIYKMGDNLMTQVMRYLTAKFFLSLATGLLLTLVFWLIGLEFAIVWGVVAFVLNFIPTLGSIAAGFATSLFALIQFWPNPVPVIIVVSSILAVNMVIGNFLDPKITGEHVGISPLLVLISLGVWGYIWGFAGMILAVPMMVIIKIVCENIPILEPVSILIGSRRSVQAKQSEQPPEPEDEEVEAQL